MSAQADAFMGIFGFKRMTCKSCLHSVQYWSQGKFGMYCEKIKREVEQEECEFFTYEPGTDVIEAKCGEVPDNA